MKTKADGKTAVIGFGATASEVLQETNSFRSNGGTCSAPAQVAEYTGREGKEGKGANRTVVVNSTVPLLTFFCETKAHWRASCSPKLLG